MEAFFKNVFPHGPLKDVYAGMKMTMQKPILILLPALFLLLAGGLPANPQEEKGTREIQEEYVEVLNAEVIVRALKKEQLVGGLQKTDFTLYENGKKQEITSFQEVKRKIGAQKVETTEPAETAAPKGRIFLFYFWVSEPEPQLEETLDFFFNRVYREGDYALLVTGNRVFKITRPDQVRQALSEVKSKLDEVTGYARMDRAAFINKMEDLLRNLEEQLPRVNDGAAAGAQTGSAAGRNVLEQFAANYKRLLDEYKIKRINLNIDKLKAIADSLKALQLEKWGLVFYQPDLVPQLDADRFIREKQDALADYTELQKTFAAISRELDKPTGSLAILEEVRRAFLETDATFHLLLSHMAPSDQLNSRFLKLDHVYSDWQEVFSNISRSTGGAVIEGNKPDQSLARAMEKVDIYYRLTYEPPKGGQAARDIEVKTTTKRIKLVYNREMTLKEPNKIAIDNFSFTPAPANATLEFTLKNYRQLYDGFQVYGNILVKVSAVDQQGEIISFERVFEPEDAAIVPSLKLNFPHGGKYTLIVEALDRHTGKSAAFSRKIETALDNREEGAPGLMIPVHEKTGGVDKKNNLDALLEKTAAYCEKLKQATFYFTCREEISDIYFIKGKEIKNDFYRHEYQIVMDEKGRMSEERKEITKDGKGKGDDDLVLTNFYSNYPFLMPGALMDRENRKKYLYRLLAKEKVGEVETFKINVEPRNPANPANPAGGIINHGVVWVDEQDGSVVKIQLDPRSLRGIDVLQETAGKKGAGLKVVDIHWYEVQSNNIRFPSRTEISEVKLAAQEELENSRTVFTYKDYRFFKVNVNVIDSGNE